MNYAGVWQDEADAVLRKWTVDSAAMAADLTGDGFVDADDLALLLANWNEDTPAPRGNLHSICSRKCCKIWLQAIVNSLPILTLVFPEFPPIRHDNYSNAS